MIFKRGQAGVPIGITQRLLYGGEPETVLSEIAQGTQSRNHKRDVNKSKSNSVVENSWATALASAIAGTLTLRPE